MSIAGSSKRAIRRSGSRLSTACCSDCRICRAVASASSRTGRSCLAEVRPSTAYAPALTESRWLDPSELRIGLGCMRLSTDTARDTDVGVATISTAVDAGVTVFDTARSYGLDDSELGHNESLLTSTLRSVGADSRVRVVTKGGMSRLGGAWLPDGRAKALLADCTASLAVLGEVDLYLIHAPDPRVPWRTTVRALARLVDDGLVRRVGVCNVNLRQLDEALDLAPIAAVQVPLSPYDVRAWRGGVVQRCADTGVAVMAHSPLGGVRRAARLGGSRTEAQAEAQREALRAVADARGATPAEVALAWLLRLSPSIVAIPGARRPETARSAAQAATLVLEPDEQERLTAAFAGLSPHPSGTGRPEGSRSPNGGDVVLVMGIPGAGKSRVAEDYLARGY